jgi:hypothetical protein
MVNRDVAVVLAGCYSHLNLISYKKNKEAKAASSLPRATADLKEGKIYAKPPVLVLQSCFSCSYLLT